MPRPTSLTLTTDEICEERRCALRRVLEAADAHDRELAERLVAHEREMREREFRSRDAELLLQAKADEVHFAALNNNLARIIEERKTFFTRDGHDDFLREYQAFKDEVNRQLTTIRAWAAAGLLILGILEFALRFVVR